MNHLEAWFSLKSVPGVGNYTYKRLLDEFDSPEAVFAAPRSRLFKVQGITEKVADAIRAHQTPATVRKNIDICRHHGIEVITIKDETYPPLLRELPDPPPYLYVKGKLIPEAACLAVVGSRNPTGYGGSLARELSRDLAGRGITVVSGLARGIDAAAHRGALDAGGRTCAVLGSGLAKIYPAENRPLAEKITENGAVISEFPILAEPESHHFPIRNRIISGMSVGTVVVEAAGKSGSLITARLAAEQGREVFAVPGSIHSFKSTGTHGLLKQGATLVESAADVMKEISHMLAARTAPAKKPENAAPANTPLSVEESEILAVLDVYPVHIDEIARKVSLDAGKTAAVLLNLELKGRVRQEPGKFFLLKEDNRG